MWDARPNPEVATAQFNGESLPKACRSRPKGSVHYVTEEGANMLNESVASNITAPTRFLEGGKERYAYRRFGAGSGLPLLCLQHFTGTMDNWDPAVTDPLASEREVILFDNAGIGRSSGSVPKTIAGMASHALAFLDGLGIETCDVLGFSLGGMVAQQMALERPLIFRRMMLVGTAPRGGEDIMHLEKPNLAKPLGDPSLQGYPRLCPLWGQHPKGSVREHITSRVHLKADIILNRPQVANGPDSDSCAATILES
jgi:pimeloyl-ACP methyl ester carboxylesterase